MGNIRVDPTAALRPWGPICRRNYRLDSVINEDSPKPYPGTQKTQRVSSWEELLTAVQLALPYINTLVYFPGEKKRPSRIRILGAVKNIIGFLRIADIPAGGINCCLAWEIVVELLWWRNLHILSWAGHLIHFWRQGSCWPWSQPAYSPSSASTQITQQHTKLTRSTQEESLHTRHNGVSFDLHYSHHAYQQNSQVTQIIFYTWYMYLTCAPQYILHFLAYLRELHASHFEILSQESISRLRVPSRPLVPISLTIYVRKWNEGLKKHSLKTKVYKLSCEANKDSTFISRNQKTIG